jgi:hypothetical protein
MSTSTSIAAFDRQAPAENLAKMLHERGIEAGLQNETADQTLRFFTGKHHAQFKVTVLDENVERALKEFAAMKPLPPERAFECPVTQVIRCPDCGSTQVEYPQYSRNTLIGALPSLASTVGLVEKDFFCRVCNFTWPPPEDTPAPPAEEALS